VEGLFLLVPVSIVVISASVLLTLFPSIKLIEVSFCDTVLGQNNSRDVGGPYGRRIVAASRPGISVGITFYARRLCRTWRPSPGIPAWGRCPPAPARSIPILCFPVRGRIRPPVHRPGRGSPPGFIPGHPPRVVSHRVTSLIRSTMLPLRHATSDSRRHEVCEKKTISMYWQIKQELKTGKVKHSILHILKYCSSR